jgi:hypothetical protein
VKAELALISINPATHPPTHPPGKVYFAVEVDVNSSIHVHEIQARTTGCFTMNDTKVVVYFSGYNASPDLKHVAKF